MLYQRKKVKVDNIFDGGSTLVIMKKQKTLQLLLITENTCNKQTMKEKDSGENKKGIVSEVNKANVQDFRMRFQACQAF